MWSFSLWLNSLCRYREKKCSVHDDKLAIVQCLSCVNLKLPENQSYHCSIECFSNTWKDHLARHCEAKTYKTSSSDDSPARKTLRSCKSWVSFVETAKQEGIWTEVGSKKYYIPSTDDYGFKLKVESKAMDYSTDTYLSVVLETNPVIFPPHPRRMLEVNSNCASVGHKESPDKIAFTVLSYNILADLYANKNKFRYCPNWALEWNYRRQNLLNEILEYNPDIICLQEVFCAFLMNVFLELAISVLVQCYHLVSHLL